MLVYGDQWRTVAPRRRLASLWTLLRPGKTGADRHDDLVRGLIEAGELAQGLADAEFACNGCDDDTPLQAAALDLAVATARKVETSWRSGFAAAGPPAWPELSRLAGLHLPDSVQCKTPEGYAHYAVYPEAYMAAARDLAGAPLLVIGLRSIGASLAAAVAAASGAASVLTLRPHGAPFDRRVSVSDRLARRIASHEGAFAVVDEGPGLSGSSFGAAADLLASLGVAGERIVFFPSHRGEPGPMAQQRHRALWRSAKRQVKTLDDLAGAVEVARWFDGSLDGGEDLSQGAWRKDLPPGGWPPVWAGSERRKFRYATASGVFVARFAGLGRTGALKFDRARALHAADFTAEPVALRRGFLLERWLPRGEPRATVSERPAVLARLSDYLSFRRLNLPAEASGADGAALQRMARVNAEALGGRDLAGAVEARLTSAERVAGRLRPVHVDARLHCWEWVQGPDGVLRKTDALDHSCAHDLIGCQDIGWDLAGAAVEFKLAPDEVRELEARVLGRPDPARTDMFRGLYCAFQAGLWTMAQGAGADRRRIARERRRYAAALTRWARCGP